MPSRRASSSSRSRTRCALGDDKGGFRPRVRAHGTGRARRESGRRRPQEVPGSEFVIDIDMLVMAVGSKTNPLIAKTTPGPRGDASRNLIVADERTCATPSKPGAVAGGDTVIGATVISP